MSEDNFKELNELIRMAGERHDTSQVRPSEEALYACLEGLASEAQLAEVQSALLGSSAFRREFKQMIADYQALTNLADDPVFQNSEPILPQALQRQLREEYPQKESSSLRHEMEAGAEAAFIPALTRGNNHGQETLKKKDIKPRDSEPPEDSFLSRMFKALVSSRAAQIGIVGAAAAVTLMLISNPTPVQLQWDGAPETIERALLIPINPRGETAPATTFESAQKAALAGFRDLGSYDISSAQFNANPQESHSFSAAMFGPLKKVTITDENDNTLGAIWINKAELSTEGLTDLQFWSLNLTTFELQQAGLTDLDHPIQLSSPTAKPMALTITYKLGIEFRFVSGLVIQ